MLGSIVPGSAALWVVLFASGYAVREFVSWYRHNAPLTDRQRREHRELLKQRLKEVANARA